MYVRDYSRRKYIIIGIFILVALLYLVRLFYLQLIETRYKLSADNIVLRQVREYPERGLIYDRNKNLLVINEAVYDLMVIPGQVKEIDTAELCGLLDITKEGFIKRMDKARRYSRYKPSVFLKQISKEDWHVIQEMLYRLPGFYPQTRTLRAYPSPIAAHLLGDVGEINAKELENDRFYRQGDYIGKSGIEKYYQNELRGVNGMSIVEVDVHNRIKGSYSQGLYDTLANPGNDLALGLEIELQFYAEQLMQKKKGSIVAIDPATGEILTLVTSPTYDPNALVGRERSDNYIKLRDDTLKPLMNRATMGTYPPGSTFKMINALIALQEGAIWEGTQFSCRGKQSRPIRCTHDHITPLALQEAIQQSCNPYFWNTFKSTLNNQKYDDSHEGYSAWYNHVMSFGFGKKFDTDIPYELGGNIPTKEYYDKVYRGSWNASTVRSLSIGQGEILITPIQLANMAVIIANKGWYYPPHVVRMVLNETDGMQQQYQKKYSTIEPKYFDIVRNAMLSVFEGDHGTARYYRMDSISQAGKTGTVQNPHGEDHSMFIAYAPADDPKIAISVVVENSGYGSTWAAPIASLLIEKYLTGEIKRKSTETRMLEGDLIAAEKLWVPDEDD